MSPRGCTLNPLPQGAHHLETFPIDGSKEKNAQLASMAATVLEKQDKRLYSDDTIPLCATIAQYRNAGSHVVRQLTVIMGGLRHVVCTYRVATGIRDTCAQITESRQRVDGKPSLTIITLLVPSTR